MNSNDYDQDGDFSSLMTGVKPLRQDKVNLYQQLPKRKSTHTRQRREKPAELSTVVQQLPASIAQSWFHHGLQHKLQRKISMGKLAIQDQLDLHGYRQHEAYRELELFLRRATRHNLRFVLIIHGKGFRSHSTSVLKPLVQNWLSEQPAVLAYCPAQNRDGGNGASYVYLKAEN